MPDVGHDRIVADSRGHSPSTSGGTVLNMSNRGIRIRRARTHNLQDLDVDVPRSQVVVFVGVSGSGKSSLVFDTIAAEASYQLHETFPPYLRNRLPKWTRPEVGEIGGSPRWW